jgi:3-deoxy-alpha-D-manno-octulosonate 8-oxidase
MQNFRIFKQVPRMLFGEGSLNRINELLPNKSDIDDYYVYVIDDVLKNGKSLSNLTFDQTDLVEWFPATKKEPSTIQVDDLKKSIVERKNEKMPLAIIGIGGGSTMDIAKAISVMLCNDGSSRNYQGWDLVQNPGIYKIGVPTISGSGSEASRTTVLMGADRKFGINSDHSMFNAIIMDSLLIKSVPTDQRFYSGMDCYIHCVESLEGTMINELARAYADKALALCDKVFLENGDNDMLMTASYMGGVSIVNSEVGICHALSYGLSIELDYRHGFANCVAFNVLDEYYGKHVTKFRDMLKLHKIVLPNNICKGMDEEAMNRMIDMTLRMERPLTNALGENWQSIMTREKIRELYHKI